jgi:hypothetical protein
MGADLFPPSVASAQPSSHLVLKRNVSPVERRIRRAIVASDNRNPARLDASFISLLSYTLAVS